MASKVFVLWTFILETWCWKCGSMKVWEVGKSEAKKVQWDLGTEVGSQVHWDKLPAFGGDHTPLMNASNSFPHLIRLLSCPTPEPPASRCHLKRICGQFRPICSCANADFPSAAFLIGCIPICFVKERRKISLVCVSAWGIWKQKEGFV